MVRLMVGCPESAEMRPCSKRFRRLFMLLLATAASLTLVTLLTLVWQEDSRQPFAVLVGKWLMEEYFDLDTDNLCMDGKQVGVANPGISRLSPSQVLSKPLMIRDPKGRDLDPKPFEFSGISRDAGSSPLARRAPQCLLLGFAKCGTSALLEFLNLHPRIVTLDWEPDYFCDRMYAKYDLQWYVKRMPPSSPDQVTIEKSPCYIVEHHAHIRMHVMNSSLKVMVLVRNPVIRLLSEYGHYSATERYWGRIPTPFIDRIWDRKTGQPRMAQLLKVGDYLPHFEHLLGLFPRSQLLVLDGDRLITDPLTQIAKVETFLGLDHHITSRDIYFDEEKGFYCTLQPDTGERRCLGQSKGRQHEKLDAETIRKLNEFFKPYNEKLFELLNEDFGWLNESYNALL